MDWVFYSSLVFVFSVVYYLILKKLQIEKVDNKLNLVRLCLPAPPMYIIWILVGDMDFSIKWEHLLIIALSTYFFSYFSNIFSVQGMQVAPNPGYSLIIQKSYAIYTALASVVLFDSELSLKGLSAIILIILFSALIMINGRTKRKTDQSGWIIPSFLAFLGYGSAVLVSKYLLNEGVNAITRSFYVNVFITMLYLIDLFKARKMVAFNVLLSRKYLLALALIMGLANGLFNAFMQLGFNSAPNVGYVNVINTSSITVVTLLSAFIFKDELNFRKMIGMCGILFGLFLLLV